MNTNLIDKVASINSKLEWSMDPYSVKDNYLLRSGHSACVYEPPYQNLFSKGCIALFGGEKGYSHKSGIRVLLSDLVLYDVENETCEKIMYEGA